MTKTTSVHAVSDMLYQVYKMVHNYIIRSLYYSYNEIITPIVCLLLDEYINYKTLIHIV